MPKHRLLWTTSVLVVVGLSIPASLEAASCTNGLACYTEALHLLQTALDTVTQPQKEIIDLNTKIGELSKKNDDLEKRVSAIENQNSRQIITFGTKSDCPDDTWRQAYGLLYVVNRDIDKLEHLELGGQKDMDKANGLILDPRLASKDWGFVVTRVCFK
jgi:hypothetical protein